jgi:glycosyltransferase involved in cell wall biosynthesis
VSKSILFDARLVVEKPTGIGRYVASLVPEMIRLGGDFHFHLLRGRKPFPGFGIAEWSAPNLTHHTTDEKAMSFTKHFMLPKLARELNADLLHYPHFDAPFLAGSLPVVATIHGARDLACADSLIGMSHIKRCYMRYFMARSLRHATVITVSHAMARDLGERFGLPSDRIAVTHEAADAEFSPAPSDAVVAFRAKFELIRPFILCVGERRPHKNQSNLVRAYAQSKSRATHDLVIIGKSYADFRGPEETVERLNLQAAVHILEPVDAADLVAAYTAADLFVLISLYEGFGLPILEAMACGTPVIGSATTATGEIIGEGGLRVPPEDISAVAAAIDEVLCDPTNRELWIDRGWKWCRRFTWEHTAQRTLAVYREILGMAA